ncbi:phosphatase PAP2 family protein [Streptomyces sp. MAD19A]|uniref:phosphatase PAP2 family protein n=1 Tax=Streptomyces sp. MAD19A TaxID=3242896 RepID=UPI0035285444
MKKWFWPAVLGVLALLTAGWLLSERVTTDGEVTPGADTYRDIASFGHDSPSWVHRLAEVGTEAGILVFLALFVAAFWLARKSDDKAMTLALFAPVAMAVTYLFSELLKGWVREDRPCRTVPDVRTIAACPEPGDWSFPSNHAVIVAASLAALFLVWRTAALLAVPIALLTAYSRVFLGVHFLHDVVAGFLLGVVIAPVVLVLLVRVGEPLVGRLRRIERLRPALVASTGNQKSLTMTGSRDGHSEHS